MKMKNVKCQMTNDFRLHWVDALRGCLILMMVVYHFAFDLDYLGLVNVDVFTGAWLLMGRIIQFGFLGLVGISLYLSYQHSDPRTFLKKQAFRALTVFGGAMLVTAGTWLMAPDSYVRFGILHLISVSILIGALMISSIPLTLAGMFLSLAMAAVTGNLHPATTALIPFGIWPADFFTLDYFPLFPWLAVVLAGTLIGRLLERFGILKPVKNPFRARPLEILGQRSLLVYLFHQPIILGLLWALIHL